MSQKLRRIRSHRLRLLLQRLRLRYIRRLLYVYLLVQLFLKAENIRLLHIVTDQNRESDILTDIYRKIVGSHYEKNDYPQQQQDKHRADARRHELHIKERSRFSAHTLTFF